MHNNKLLKKNLKTNLVTNILQQQSSEWNNVEEVV